MLVEDEFQAIAQSYTAHLHHAEYKRLMRLAREKKAEQQRNGTDALRGKKIPDNVSGETRQRLKRKLLSERQSSGVKGMLGTGLANGTDDEESDEDEAREAVLAREEKKVGDMWAGTALGGLMSWDHGQERPSLKGLEKLGVETRASRGFGPGSKQTSEKRSKMSDTETVPVEAKRVKKSELKVPTTSETRAHLHKSTVATTRVERAAERHNSSTRESDSPPRDGPRKAKHENKLNKPTKGKYRSFIDSLDDFDDAVFDATQAAESSNSPDKTRSRLGTQSIKKDKKDRKDRLDEVPVFLI